MVLKENCYICLDETNFDDLIENCLESVSSSHKVTFLDFCNIRYFFQLLFSVLFCESLCLMMIFSILIFLF